MHDEIPSALDGERIDRVAALMTGLSRSVVAQLISEGKIITTNSPLPAVPSGLRRRKHRSEDA